jgi:hypothetical protein
MPDVLRDCHFVGLAAYATVNNLYCKWTAIILWQAGQSLPRGMRCSYSPVGLARQDGRCGSGSDASHEGEQQPDDGKPDGYVRTSSNEDSVRSKIVTADEAIALIHDGYAVQYRLPPDLHRSASVGTGTTLPGNRHTSRPRAIRRRRPRRRQGSGPQPVGA